MRPACSMMAPWEGAGSSVATSLSYTTPGPPHRSRAPVSLTTSARGPWQSPSPHPSAHLPWHMCSSAVHGVLRPQLTQCGRREQHAICEAKDTTTHPAGLQKSKSWRGITPRQL